MRVYKYIFFDAGELIGGKIDTDNYYYTCTLDLRQEHDVEVVTFPSVGHSRFFHILFVLSQKLSKRFACFSFFSRAFYPYYFPSNAVSDHDKVCFIIYAYYITPDYLRYLRLKYPNAKIVKIHRDSYKIWRKKNALFNDNDMRELFDLQFSYDLGDSQKYNMIHFDEIESKVDIPISDDYPLYDVFFAGAAKDRLSFLVETYDYLERNGVKPYFYITNVDKKDQLYRKGIQYATKNMTYREMLEKTINSRVVLEVNQGCVDGFTSRFLEAVMYNKKLLTNNVAVKNNRYYNDKFIQVFSKTNDISIDFILSENKVDFEYNNEFSPIHLINLIDQSLVEKYGK